VIVFEYTLTVNSGDPIMVEGMSTCHDGSFELVSYPPCTSSTSNPSRMILD